MSESIEIKNLGPVRHINIENIQPFTIFIGESGSGKSTIMKAIALFRWLYKMHNIRSYLKHSKISKSPFRFRKETYFKNCGFEQFIKKDTEIIYTVKAESGNIYTVRFANNKIYGVEAMELVKPQDICFNKISFISETRNIIPLWADRGASFTGGYLGFYFHEVFKDFDLATEAIKEIEMNFLKLKFSIKKTSNGKKYVVESSSDYPFEIDFKNSSSGTQTSVPISLITHYFSKFFSFEDAFNRSVLAYLSNTDELTGFKAVKNLSEIDKKIFIHIEEPELSLYPDAQCELVSDMIGKCFIQNSNSIEVMFSTHSPYIINHLNLLIRAFEKSMLVDGVSYDFNKLSVYEVIDGTLESLTAKNMQLVDTNPLSETINMIYSKYNSL